MHTALVLDCSVTMAWCFEDESTEATRSVLRALNTAEAAVPGLWYLEVANVLASAERRGRLDRVRVIRFTELLGDLPIVVQEDGPERALGPLLDLAHRTRLSVYDATYLEIAIRRQLPLASLDEDLRRAASELGVAVLGS